METFREAKEEAKQASEESVSSSSTASGTTTGSDQPKIDLVFAQKQPCPRNSARFKVLNNSVCYFISKDMHPCK